MPSSLSTGLSALFFAHEKAEVPAALTIVSALIKVSLGTLALLAGLRASSAWPCTSIVVNVVTFVILARPRQRVFFTPRREGDPLLRRGMLRESFPLMLNHLLATLFFKVDVPMLKAIQSPAAVGWYSAGLQVHGRLQHHPGLLHPVLLPGHVAHGDPDRTARWRVRTCWR